MRDLNRTAFVLAALFLTSAAAMSGCADDDAAEPATTQQVNGQIAGKPGVLRVRTVAK